MKVVIQNGATHSLSRKQAEAIVALFPGSWLKAVDSLTLYQSDGEALHVKHYPKARAVGVFWPSSSHPQPTAAEAIRELLVALAIAVERGNLPPKVSKAMRARAEQEVATLLTQCTEVLHRSDA
jgi:hypothetical protein